MAVCYFLRFVLIFIFFFFFNDTATTEIYTLSLHDALPILPCRSQPNPKLAKNSEQTCARRSEEHTSELQSPWHLVCRLLLEKKKQQNESPQPFNLHTRLNPLPDRSMSS